MKELSDIVQAYGNATRAGRRTALATVVAVEGSSYRRPGARMLVCEDGNLTGAISGGCLEGDALRKALFAMEQGKNRLVTYDSMDEDGELFGTQLGCNGVVHILLEPIRTDKANHPIALLRSILERREPACLATLFSPNRYEGAHPGTCMLRQGASSFISAGAEEVPASTIRRDMEQVLGKGTGYFQEYSTRGMHYNVLLDYIPLPVSLVIAGAGNDAMPLAQIANILGWHVTVIDGRPTHVTAQRFPQAGEVKLIRPGDALPFAAAYVLMSHNYLYDLAMLRALTNKDCAYIGILGPQAKRDRMLADLESKNGFPAESLRQKLFGPAGLDLGTETAEEIALAIIAEIKAVLSGRIPLSLRERKDFIHPRVGL